MGLSVCEGDPELRERLLARTHEALAHAYAPNTNKGDDGHWRAWEKVCARMRTSPWRTDLAANSGADPDGYQEEIFLCASATIQMYDDMCPRRKTDPAADPRSAGKKMEGVSRRHLTRGITMVPLKLVKLAVKGLCRAYVEMYGVETLAPDRKLPFPDAVCRDMFRTPQGARRGALQVDWSSYYWRSVNACFATLAEEGSRKDEVAKDKESTPFRKGRFTFDSLRWKIDGREVVNPSVAQLRSLRPGDGVWLRHGVAKNDAFGSYFAATPSFLAYRADTERCACRALAELEIAAALEPAQRKSTPLFGPSPGEEFTHSQLDSALELLLVEGGGVPEDELHKYSVHSFRIYVACALLEADCPRWLIKRLLRWRGDESLDTYGRTNDDKWASWVGKSIHVSVDSTVASRFADMDFSPEVQKRMHEVATAMLAVNAATARAALA